MSRQLRPSPTCLNCGHAVSSRFCAECGQENTSYHVSIGRLIADLFEELFQLESRLWRSLWLLFRKPGLLTREYNAGRRVSYTTPLRLYLIASVTYFFVGSVMPHHSERIIKFDPPSASDAAEIEHASPLLHKYFERVVEAQKDPKAAGQRVQAALSEWGSRIAAGLVPFLALLTWLFFRRPKLFFVEHLVFALHMHATAFLLMSVGDLARWKPVNVAVTVGIPVLMFLAMRRVFAQSRLRTSWKFVLVWIFYGIAVGIGIGVVAAIGFFARS